jgi:hypothetical protein
MYSSTNDNIYQLLPTQIVQRRVISRVKSLLKRDRHGLQLRLFTSWAMRLGHNSQVCSAQWGESGAFSVLECRPSGVGVADSVKGDACMDASR